MKYYLVMLFYCMVVLHVLVQSYRIRKYLASAWKRRRKISNCSHWYYIEYHTFYFFLFSLKFKIAIEIVPLDKSFNLLNKNNSIERNVYLYVVLYKICIENVMVIQICWIILQRYCLLLSCFQYLKVKKCRMYNSHQVFTKPNLNRLTFHISSNLFV